MLYEVITAVLLAITGFDANRHHLLAGFGTLATGLFDLVAHQFET